MNELEQSEWEWEIQQAVMTIIARAANHEALSEHPLRQRGCNCCEIAQMIENMVRTIMERPSDAEAAAFLDQHRDVIEQRLVKLRAAPESARDQGGDPSD